MTISYGCSSTVTVVDTDSGLPNADSGPIKKDSAVPDSSPLDSALAVCGPVDTTAYTPRPYSPPSGKAQKKCTTLNIDDYVLCIEGTDKTKCAQFGNGQPAAACGTCIESGATDPAWGPFVSPDGKTLSFNVPGCLDLAVPATQCGKALDASYGCQDAACTACDNTTTPDFSACVTSALKKECKTYGAAVDTACAAQFGDAAPPEVNNCFADSTIADPKAQDADYVKRIVTYFCGP